MNSLASNIFRSSNRRAVADAIRSRRRGFTLIEVLATLMLLAIVMPAIMKGVSLATRAASASKRRTEASVLATSKLNEMIATGQWQSSGSGDFSGDGWPDYTWEIQTSDWNNPNSTSGIMPTLTQTVEQLDITVSWNGGGDGNSITMSTLVYPNTATSTLAINNAATAAAASTTGTTQ